MDVDFDDLIDNSLVDQCDQIRSIARKSWLNSAHVSLSQLDEIRAKVYNVGLTDPKDLKVTNIRNNSTKCQQPGIQSNPPLTGLATHSAWGSNNSLPDLVKQQLPLSGPAALGPCHRCGADVATATAAVRSRPGSAKYSSHASRPPSGKRQRPQSAKDQLLHGTVTAAPADEAQNFGVKGAHVDQSSRPPKGIPPHTGSGWVGPPAGLKYPDAPTKHGLHPSQMRDMAPSPVPPIAPPGSPALGEQSSAHKDADLDPDCGTPTSSQGEEKTRRVFELFIGNPYKTEEEEFASDDSDDEILYSNHLESNASPALLRKPTPDALHLSLPVTDNEEEEDEIDTDRLLEQADVFSKKMNLQSIVQLNKGIDPGGSSEPTNQNSLQTDHARTEQETREDLAAELSQQANLVQEDFTMLTLQPQVADSHPLGKASVKFNEGQNRTVDITPRNIGRKVSDMFPKKKHSSNNFVDLIAVKNRIEPVFSTTRIDISPRKQTGRPPSGKSRHFPLKSSTSPPKGGNKTVEQVRVESLSAHGTVIHGTKDDTCLHGNMLKTKANRPMSAPRSGTPVAMVTVAYGDEEEKKKGPPQEVKTELKLEGKKKKPVRKTVNKDVVTLMQQLSEEEADKGANSAGGPDMESEELSTGNQKQAAPPNFPTVCTSEPEKNYYDISCQSSKASGDKQKEEDVSSNTGVAAPTTIKTTKTILFNELQPEEVTVKSLLDHPSVPVRDSKAKFLSTPPADTDKQTVRPRPHSANLKPPIAKKPLNLNNGDGRHDDQMRPGSRLGFVAMAPSSGPGKDQKPGLRQRPSSAPSTKCVTSASKVKVKDKTDTKTNIKQVSGDGKVQATEANGEKGSEVSAEEKADRDKVIDNLLERTKSLLGAETKNEVKTEERKKRIRPMSAYNYNSAARTKDQRRVKSGVPKRSDICTHRSRSSGKKTSRKLKPPEPYIINTKSSLSDGETEEDLECVEMTSKLAEKGLNIRPETLQRALYPPTGRTRYFDLTHVNLPKTSSVRLLNHPRAWLPDEYKRLRSAERTLSRANEIMALQKRAEERRARLAEKGDGGVKRKSKGKKGVKKVKKKVDTLG